MDRQTEGKEIRNLEQFSRCSGIKCDDNDENDDAPSPSNYRATPLSLSLSRTMDKRFLLDQQERRGRGGGGRRPVSVSRWGMMTMMMMLLLPPRCQNGKPGKQRARETIYEDRLKFPPTPKSCSRTCSAPIACGAELTPRRTDEPSLPPRIDRFHLRSPSDRCPIVRSAFKVGETSDFIAVT